MNPAVEILLIEDNPGDRDLVTEHLANPGFACRVRHASTLGESMGLLQETAFDAVLLDLGLPDSEGIGTLRRLCAKFPEIPVVVITGLDDHMTALEAVKSGAQDFLVKGSLSGELLIRSIRYAIERSRLLQQRDRHARIVANSREAMALVDPGYRYLEVNRAYERLVNRAAEEIVGYSVSEVVGEENFEKKLKPRLDLCLTGQEVRFDTDREVAGMGHRFVETIYSPCMETGGTVTAVAVCIRDVSKQKHDENALIESEERFRRLSEATFEGIVTHQEGVLLNANDQFFEMFGYKPSELLGKQIIPFIFAPEAISAIEGRIREGALGFHESLGMKKDGTRFPIETRVREAEYEGRKVRMAAIRDVTALKVSEQALRRERERLIKYFDITPCIIVALDQEGRIGMLNQEGAQLLACKVDDCVGKNWFENFIPDDVRENARAVFDGLMAGELETFEVAEHEVIGADGARKVILWNNAVTRNKAGRVSGTLSAGLDITERKNFETALHESEERFRRLAEASFEGVAIHEEGVLLSANNQYFRMFGYGQEELMGKKVIPLTIAPGSREYIETQISAGFLGPYETTGMRKDGSTFPMEIRVREIEHEGNTVRVGAFRDITERQKADEALSKSEEKYRALFTSSADAIMTLAPPSWVFTSGNPAALAMFQAKDEADFTSRTLWEVSPEFQPDGRPSAEKARDMIGTAMREGSNLFEWTHRRLNGQNFPATVLLARVEIEGKQLLQATVRDMTEMRAMQASLAQSDRLASMGMLAAGVAHEINNPLAFVLYNLESLTKDIPELTRRILGCRETLRSRFGDEQLSEMLGADLDIFNPLLFEDMEERFQDALGGSQRIKEIARGLGTFSRVEQDRFVPVDIQYTIECAINMAFNEIKYRARLVKDFEPVPTVMASEGRLSQVFLNFLVNASHAIEEGDVDHNEIRIRTWVEDGEVCARVSDTGKGIPKENLERIFDPFFSTKGPGVGSGLGLAISRNIVAGYQGRIEVESEVGKGTSFVLRFPVRREDELEHPDAACESPASMEIVSGRVLVVDDERGVRAAMKRMLGQDHEVVTADSGEKARNILEKEQDFDVILCDMMMPAMSGMDLHKWLVDEYPRLAKRLVFVSGGAFTPRARDYLARVDNLRVDKPFGTGEMIQLVNRLVTSARAESGKNRAGK